MSEQTIWNRLRDLGFNEYATAGIMGNIKQESLFKSNIVQMGYGWTDEDYTNAVDTGTYTLNQFMHDSIGYGLCQWTYYSRKQGLYNLAKNRNVSISDETMQLDYLYYELTTEYKEVYNDLIKAESCYDATYAFCVKFERPADMYNQVSYRNQFSEQIYNQFSGTYPASDLTDTTIEVETPVEIAYTPTITIVKKGTNSKAAKAVQCLLNAQKDTKTKLDEDGDIGVLSYTEICDFQLRRGLNIDGIVGELTWQELIKT